MSANVEIVVVEECPTEPESAPKTVVRTLRAEVVFVGMRDKERLALWGELWRVGDDLRRAANRTITALFQVKMGLLPHPESLAQRGAAKGTTRPTPIKSLAYQAVTGSWQPFGMPMYQPSEGTRRASSSVLLEVATMVYTRIQTDWPDIQRGDQSLPSWRSLPVGFAQRVEVDPQTGIVTLPLWAGRGATRLKLRFRKLDARLWGDLRRALDFGNARLVWDKPPGRKGRWMLSLSAEYPRVDKSKAPIVAAVRLGMYTTCTLAYARHEDSEIVKFSDSVDLPGSTWRQVRRVERERTERLRWNRKDRGQRKGRGRQRKLRVVEPIGDVVARVTDTALRQTAAAVVATAMQRGAGVLALPDLTRWSVADELDRTEDLTRQSRAGHRRWYFRWHQGTLRQYITEAAKREGLRVIEVNPARAGATCAHCGEFCPEARQERRWEHSCGYKASVEENTARVLVRRALEVVRSE